jgi:hypothetical protein
MLDLYGNTRFRSGGRSRRTLKKRRYPVTKSHDSQSRKIIGKKLSEPIRPIRMLPCRICIGRMAMYSNKADKSQQLNIMENKSRCLLNTDFTQPSHAGLNGDALHALHALIALLATPYSHVQGGPCLRIATETRLIHNTFDHTRVQDHGRSQVRCFATFQLPEQTCPQFAGFPQEVRETHVRHASIFVAA